MIETKYLVRPGDYEIFERNEKTGLYGSYSHFSYGILTAVYGFFPIKDYEVKFYEVRNKIYHTEQSLKTQLSEFDKQRQKDPQKLWEENKKDATLRFGRY